MRRLCPNRIDFTKDHAEQSSVLRRTLMIKNFPAQIPPRALYTVASMRGTSFTMRFTPMQKDSARKLINEQLRNKAVMSSKKVATEQMDAIQEANDIKNFYAEITRNQNTVYSISIYIEIYAKTLDALNDLEQQVKIELAGVGITYDQLHYEQRGDFQSAQPLGSDHFILCSNNLPSKTAAALYPFSYSSLVHPQGMPSGAPTVAARCMWTSSSGMIKSPTACSLFPALPGKVRVTSEEDSHIPGGARCALLHHGP